MTQLDPNHLREVTSFDDVIEYLTNELDWPIGASDLEDATFDWDPDELGIPAERVPHLVSLRQLRPLESTQPWGIFFLEFDGPRLPLTALRRLLDKLVAKKRASGSGTLRTWKLDDLLFIITTSTGDTVELHFIAFFEQPSKPAEIRSIPWRPGQSPAQHLRRLATELLPNLAWPEDPAEVDSWRATWRRAFRLRHGEAIRSTTRLVDRMATTARQVRDDLIVAIRAEEGTGPFSRLLTEVEEQLVGSVDEAQFADMCAQTLVYGAMTARVTDPVGFGASPTLSAIPLANPFLAAFFEEVHDHAAELDGGEDGLEQLVADLKASDVESILDQFGATAKGGDPVIHFYEDFLQAYDPKMKIDAGAFYTPQAAVKHMVATVDEVLRSRLGLSMGVADATTWGELAGRLGLALPGSVDPSAQFVSVLDPATGTGTFLVEWIRQAKQSFAEVEPAGAWPDHVRQHVLPTINALELMLAPYAIAHLKVALELHEDAIDDQELGIFLTDTLERGGSGQLSLEPDAISVEGERANKVKESVRTTVCIGNPPYDRVARDAGGGWITDRSAGRSLLDDLLDVAREHTIFSHHASLYNKYVYFWRFALWKVFEDRPNLPGVISLITPSSWLNGPGFMGLRQLVRELADEVWVTDLGGDNRGTRREENIFEIETPVAIVTICRSGAGDRTTPATVRYRRVSGSAAEKLALLGKESVDLEGEAWADAPIGWRDDLMPISGGADWADFPSLIDLFPWQQPGCMYNRTWPIGPSSEVLQRRWERFVATSDAADRARCYVTPNSGRTIMTKVPGLPRLVDEPIGAPAPAIAPYGYRSFDRHHALGDPRLAKTESPSLWASVSSRQIFMTSMTTTQLGSGPAATAALGVPDKHHFRGSFGGKDVLPLYRDRDLTPNIDRALLAFVSDRITGSGGATVGVEELFSYAYAVLAGADYTDRFREELETPGPRVPLSADPFLFAEAVELGKKLLWLHTYGERFAEGRLPSDLLDARIQVVRPIQELPENVRSIHYDPVAEELHLGGGVIHGVSSEVWDFEVSGMQVVKKWLGYRTATGAGKAASSSSPLDHIRPTAWSEDWTTELLELLSVLQHTLDIRPQGVDLLERICGGPLISAGDLPAVPAELREPPAMTRAAPADGLGL